MNKFTDSQQNVRCVKTACDLDIQNSMFLIIHKKLFHCFSFLIGYVFEKPLTLNYHFFKVSVFAYCRPVMNHSSIILVFMNL